VHRAINITTGSSSPLRETVGADERLVTTLDAFRKKRNVGEYERAGVASNADAAEMRKLAERVRDDVVEWLRKNHSHLLVEL
jgi:hypothetical protein